MTPRRFLAACAAACLGLNPAGFGFHSQNAYAASTTTASVSDNKSGDSESSSRVKFGGTGSGMLSLLAPMAGKPSTCPLKHTDVKAEISGYVARVTVKQVFENTFKDKIEAAYTFPLSDTAAVDEMEMKIGNRTIHGTIKKREEARQIYDQARQAGHVASLLDQERTNIFTQSVANIEPGAKVEITLKYVDLLPYEAGTYTFAFPTVVGPRFMPGAPTGHQGTGRAPDTTEVPDASNISPQVSETRSGADISIDVHVNEGGLPVEHIASKLHPVAIAQHGGNDAEVHLMNKSAIPNKDFVLTWGVAGDRLKSGYLTHKDDKTGYFTVMMMPPKRVKPAQVAPKEMIFLIDCSGSQSGAPLQKAKEAMLYILDHMNANDTFQVISFNNELRLSSEKPIKADGKDKEAARAFVESLTANGGTWMAPAVEKACSIPADEHRLRIVTFMTDGYVGNDYEILGMVRKLRGNSRWFPFGTGNSVNRTLIDGIANEGGGEPEYVMLNSSANEVGKRFYDRISSPVLTDVKLDWHGLAVKEVFPHAISDVWAERPLYITGTYVHPGQGTLTISGFAGGKPYKQDLHVVFPEKQTANDVLGSIWARKKVDRLMAEDWFGAQSGRPNPELKDEIVRVALEHHIMTQYTSFVAVDDKDVTKGNGSRKVPVEVDMPDGVSREQTVGGNMMRSHRGAMSVQQHYAHYTPDPSQQAPQVVSAIIPAPVTKSAAGGAFGYGTAGGIGNIAPSVSTGMPTGAPHALPRQSAAWYKAPRELQMASNRPIVHDCRQAPGPSQMACLPPPPLAGARAIAAGDKDTERDELKRLDRGSAVGKKQKPSQVTSIEFIENEKKPAVTGNDHSKLDAKLNAFLVAVAKNGGHIEGVKVQKGHVLVKITLNGMEKKVLNELKSRGVRITIVDRGFIIAEVPTAQLLGLTALPEVKLIEAAK